MYVQLERIIIFNFKSFRGKVVIGPIKPFTAIIGANGSGKSNVMDAISFVMGEKTKRLRVNQLNQLIYGATTGTPLFNRAYVTAIFIFEDNTNKSFTRSIHNTYCEYKINDEVVAADYYTSALKELNLNVKAKNFLIFQGAIDSTILKTPNEYTHMFEEISNSIELKGEYERLKNEIFEAQNEIHYLYKSKKDLLLKKKDALLVKDEADKYKELCNQYLNSKTKLHFFELFHIKENIHDLEDTLKTAELELNEYENENKIVIEFLNECKNRLKESNKNLENTEQNLAKADDDLKKKEINFTQIKEKVLYWEQKINSMNLSLLEAQKSHSSHIKTMKELESELMQMEHIKNAFEENMATQMLSQDSSVALNDKQV